MNLQAMRRPRKTLATAVMAQAAATRVGPASPWGRAANSSGVGSFGRSPLPGVRVTLYGIGSDCARPTLLPHHKVSSRPAGGRKNISGLESELDSSGGSSHVVKGGKRDDVKIRSHAEDPPPLLPPPSQTRLATTSGPKPKHARFGEGLDVLREPLSTTAQQPAWLTLHSVGISTRQSVSRNSLRLPRMGNLAGPARRERLLCCRRRPRVPKPAKPPALSNSHRRCLDPFRPAGVGIFLRAWREFRGAETSDDLVIDR